MASSALRINPLPVMSGVRVTPGSTLGQLTLCLMLMFPVRVPGDDGSSDLTPDQEYSATVSNPVVWDGELQFIITPPYGTKLLRVWVPVPPSDSAQTVSLTEFSTFPSTVKPRISTEPVFGNTFACFDFPNPQGARLIRHRLIVRTHELTWNMEPEKVRIPSEWSPLFLPYLRGEEQSVVIDDPLRSLFGKVVPQRGNPLRDFEAVLEWADQNLTYDHTQASLMASSRHALTTRRGHCSDYHGFCAAMGRVMSVPTRITYGINPFPKASPSHCKLEAFLPPYGWVSFDVSETQKLADRIRSDQSLSESERQSRVQKARQRLVSGFRDNTWFLQTRGTDYELAPPASHRVPVVRTLYAEADGVPLPDPDPSDPTETTFAWMTVHRFDADVPFSNPYTNSATLMLESDAAGK